MIILQGAYFLPSMAFTLISVSCIDHACCSILIKDGACILCGACPQCLFLRSVPQIHGLYHLDPSALVNPPKLHINIATPSMDINELHRKLSHLNFCTLQKMVSKGTVQWLKKLFQCLDNLNYPVNSKSDKIVEISRILCQIALYLSFKSSYWLCNLVHTVPRYSQFNAVIALKWFFCCWNLCICKSSITEVLLWYIHLVMWPMFIL